MKQTVILITLLVFSLFAYANDSTAVIVGGRLEFKKSHDITLLTEDLFISTEKVRVTYRFRNESRQDIEETIVFPIEQAMWDYQDDNTSYLTDFVNSIDFKLSSDAPVTPVEHEVSFDKKRETARVIFHWKQKFPAGKIITVHHEYQPNGGFIISKYANEAGELVSSKKAWVKEWQPLIDEYCIEPKLNDWIFQHGVSTNVVHYILTTGANWKTPIQHFRLRIQKDNPQQKVSLCADNIKKINSTTFQLEQDNFLPGRDLRVLFINPNP